MDGKSLAKSVRERLSHRVKGLRAKGVIPTLATLFVGGVSSSRIYIEGKRRDCAEVGIEFKLFEFPSTVEEDKILKLIEELNGDDGIHGIIVQLPVPPHLNPRKLIERINPAKDVDGLHSHNVGKLWTGGYSLERSLLPCTPKGIMYLLDRYKVRLEGRLAVIINRSDLVGKPLAKLFLDRNATVVLCHSKTYSLPKRTREADVVVSAVGRRPEFVLTEGMVRRGAVVIDVGMNYLNGKLVGDVDFEGVKHKVAYITPVPGGVGPMTRAMLLQNTVIAAERSLR